MVDFRYSSDPRLEWWFDHHVSGVSHARRRGALPRSSRAPHKFYDPKARSCAKFLAETCAAHVRLGLVAVRRAGALGRHHRRRAVREPTRGGRAGRAGAAAHDVGREQPRSRAQAALHRRADARGRSPRSPPSPTSTTALAPILERHKRGDRHHPRARQDTSAAWSSFDVADDGLDAYNKFIPYYLFPDCHYVVGVSLSTTRAKVSVGIEPVAARSGAPSTSRRCASATAAAAIRWSARCRCKTDELARARAGGGRDRRRAARAAPRGEGRRRRDAVVRRGVASWTWPRSTTRSTRPRRSWGSATIFAAPTPRSSRTPEGHGAALRRQGAPRGRLQSADGADGQARRVVARARSAGARAGGQAVGAPADPAQAGNLRREGQGDRTS